MKRRNFIKYSGAITASGLILPSSFASIFVPKAKEKLGVALVGLGYYSTDLLAPGLQFTEHCELKGIVSGSPDKIARWMSKYNLKDTNIYNYSNFDSIANNPEIDIIYIVLPPSMHREYAERASAAGKHVWCEKPMAPTAADCQAMIDACKKNKVSLAIGYRMHHEPQTQLVQKWAKEKPFGKIKTLTAKAGYRENRTDHWKQKKAMGGGVMGDMGVYPLNAVRYVTGLEPIAVTAKASTTRPEIYNEVEETMNFELEFPGGLVASCEASFGKNQNTIDVQCKKGWYKIDPFQAYSGAEISTSEKQNFKEKLKHQQAKQMDDDAMAIKANKPMMVPGEEGLKDMKIVDAIYKSVALGKEVKI
jgi:glucose-fructose oxidoreductase